MKRFILSMLFSIILNYPSYGVYLRYEDEGAEGSKVRHIMIDFRAVHDVKENSRRISEIASKTGVSFTRAKTVRKIKNGVYSYVREEEDFFASSCAQTFAKWVESADEIRSLKFLGVDSDVELTSVKNALIFIARQHTICSEVDEFFVIDEDSSFDRSADFELSIIDPVKEKSAPAFWNKFKNVSITCKGVKETEARQKIRGILKSHYADIKANFIMEPSKESAG